MGQHVPKVDIVERDRDDISLSSHPVWWIFLGVPLSLLSCLKPSFHILLSLDLATIYLTCTMHLGKPISCWPRAVMNILPSSLRITVEIFQGSHSWVRKNGLMSTHKKAGDPYNSFRVHKYGDFCFSVYTDQVVLFTENTTSWQNSKRSCPQKAILELQNCSLYTFLCINFFPQTKRSTFVGNVFSMQMLRHNMIVFHLHIVLD